MFLSSKGRFFDAYKSILCAPYNNFMQTILVTGSNGLLGQKITEKVLTDGGVNLIDTSRGKNKYPTDSNYTYVEMDVTNYAKVAEVLNAYKPDTVIHTAAMTNVDICHAERQACWALNVDATKNLASLCDELNIHFIYISTDFVFDGLNGPYKEDDTPNPVSYYGESKLAGELATQQMNGSWAIIRTILVYGILHDMSRNNIVLWAKGALEKGLPINVVNDQWRMPTLADELASACLLAAQQKAEGIYHISGKEMMTIVDIVKAVAKFWNLDQSLINEVSSATLNQEAKRPLKTGFVLNKAVTQLGYKPHTFTEALQLVDAQMQALNR